MLRKFSNIIIALLLIITTSGFTISMHYCGTKLVSVSVDNKAQSCCNDENGHCCHDVTEYFRLKEDFITSFVQFNFENIFPVELANIPTLLSEHLCKAESTGDLFIIADSSPPLKVHSVLAQLQTYLL